MKKLLILAFFVLSLSIFAADKQYVIVADKIFASHELDQDINEFYPEAQGIIIGKYELNSDVTSLPIDDLKVAKINLIKARTNDILDYGVEYSDVRFAMTQQNKFDYKTVYDKRDSLTYPYIVMGEDNEQLSLANSTEVANWFDTGFDFIQNTLHADWACRASINELTTQRSVLDYTDPR